MNSDLTPTSAGARGNRTEMAASLLRDLIVEGELEAGQPIREKELAQRLGVSRTPLREAFKMLSIEGLVTLTPNRGAVVTFMNVEDVEEVIQLLSAIEGLAADLLCLCITDTEVAAIEQLHQRMLKCHQQGDLRGYFELNQRIHQAIIEASGNKVIAETYRVHSAKIRRYRYVGNKEHTRWDKAVFEHEQILSAIQDRDAALLGRILQSHLRNGWRLVRERMVQETEGDLNRRAAGA